MRPPVKRISFVVAHEYGADDVTARQMICYLAHADYGYSISYLARVMGVDYSTISAGLLSFAYKCGRVDKIEYTVERVREVLQGSRRIKERPDVSIRLQ